MRNPTIAHDDRNEIDQRRVEPMLDADKQLEIGLRAVEARADLEARRVLRAAVRVCGSSGSTPNISPVLRPYDVDMRIHAPPHHDVAVERSTCSRPANAAQDVPSAGAHGHARAIVESRSCADTGPRGRSRRSAYVFGRSLRWRDTW